MFGAGSSDHCGARTASEEAERMKSGGTAEALAERLYPLQALEEDTVPQAGGIPNRCLLNMARFGSFCNFKV